MSDGSFASQLTWDEYDRGSARFHVPLFGEELRFVYFPVDRGPPQITRKMEMVTRDVLELGEADLDRLKDLLWEEFVFSFVVTDYGVVQNPGESAFEAYQREFEVRNRDDAWMKSHLYDVDISAEMEELESRYAVLCVDAATDNYLNVIVKDGRIVDLDDDGTVLSWFEADATAAQKKRQNILVQSLSEGRVRELLAAGRAGTEND